MSTIGFILYSQQWQQLKFSKAVADISMWHKKAISLYRFFFNCSVFPHGLVLGGQQVYVSIEVEIGFDFQKLINDGLPK